MNEQLAALISELERGEDANAVNSAYYRRGHGEVKVLDSRKDDKAGADNLFMRGYTTTNAPDLANEVIVPTAWEKHLLRYKSNPMFLWMHDRNIPIGKVNSMHIDEKGLYLDEIEIITEIPIVKEFIGPLIRNGVLKRMSVGFLSMDGKYEEGIYYHTLTYKIESSLVSIPCNPEAEAEMIKDFGFKGLSGQSTLDELVRGYHYKTITENDRQKFFVMKAAPIGEETVDTQEAVTPNFIDVVPTEYAHKDVSEQLDPEGTFQGKVLKYHKGYNDFGNMAYAGYSTSSKAFLFPLAYKTESGIKYDWNLAAISLCRLLGAKGKASYEPKAYKAMVSRLCEVYTYAEKRIPEVELDGTKIAISDVAVEYMDTLTFKNVEFFESEKSLFSHSVFQNDLNGIKDYLKNLDDEDRKSPEMAETVKEFYTSLHVYGFIDDAESAAVAAEVMELLAPDPVEEEETPGAFSGEPYEDDKSQELKEFEAALAKFRGA